MSDRDILDCPMGQNDADAYTIRGYFAALARKVWEEDERFSGKRPFGNSGWWDEPISALVAAGILPVGVDTETARDLIACAIDSMGSEPAMPSQPSPPSPIQLRTEAMRTAEEFVKTAAVDKGGYPTLNGKDKVTEILRVARFLLADGGDD